MISRSYSGNSVRAIATTIIHGQVAAAAMVLVNKSQDAPHGRTCLPPGSRRFASSAHGP
ncbi:hypothetical protein MES5069_270150 [Mesorhizobium escarrei]|uniref:Uncharacterized protein n=1 Tax=Mesorhizobium escarrei TaxID=666018 RepID=A0ABM9DW09_9HYPH|nr:hypothetical protein MES5069_270150 [Mesorhizobium escarrei]